MYYVTTVSTPAVTLHENKDQYMNAWTNITYKS